MTFYLNALAAASSTKVWQLGLIPEDIEEDKLEESLQEWFKPMVTTEETASKHVSALYVDHHWFPVVVIHKAGAVEIHTTPGAHEWVWIAVRGLGIEFTIIPTATPQLFPNDCGFQVVAWIMESVFEPSFAQPLHTVKAMPESTAISWRGMFEHHLKAKGTDMEMIIPAELYFGGTNQLRMDTMPSSHPKKDAPFFMTSIQQATRAGLQILGKVISIVDHTLNEDDLIWGKQNMRVLRHPQCAQAMSGEDTSSLPSLQKKRIVREADIIHETTDRQQSAEMGFPFHTVPCSAFDNGNHRSTPYCSRGDIHQRKHSEPHTEYDLQDFLRHYPQQVAWSGTLPRQHSQGHARAVYPETSHWTEFQPCTVKASQRPQVSWQTVVQLVQIAVTFVSGLFPFMNKGHSQACQTNVLQDSSSPPRPMFFHAMPDEDIPIPSGPSRLGFPMAEESSHQPERNHPGFCQRSPSVAASFLPSQLQSCLGKPRLQVLGQQGSWVANDEMTFYVQQVADALRIDARETLVIEPDQNSAEVNAAIFKWLHNHIHHGSAREIISAILVANHWYPIHLQELENNWIIHTTPEAEPMILHVCPFLGIGIHVELIDLPVGFPCDCGFQTAKWLQSIAALARSAGPFECRAITEHEACLLRLSFADHLIEKDIHMQPLLKRDSHFGGTGTQDIAQQLQQLLQERGVPHDAVQERTHKVMEQLGRQALTKAFRSQNVWKEIKQLANFATPKVQLVLPSELQEAIAARAALGKQIGTKQKKQRNDRPTRKELQILPQDITIPEGIFRDAANTSLRQIQASAIGPQASGVVVMLADQAVPYLRFSQAVSKHGLGLLVLDHNNPLLHGSGETVRFPAKCERTNEPILITGKLIQIGQIEVSRSTPAQTIRVEEVQTEVVRVITYRDELHSMPWSKFLNRPIKCIVDDTPFLQGETNGSSPIIDVWDRQWLNEKLEKVPPNDAALFIACFRVELTDLHEALTTSGNVAHYVEPRSQDGRAPHPGYRVIWINKKDKQAVILASQSTSQWTCLVRSGQRFGLRVLQSDAQAVHQLHKPQTQYLASDDILTFHAGPFPHGSNRGALVKLFTAWGWQARPCQPKSRTPNGLGVIWEVQAANKPQFEVYQLAHADILITEVPKRTPKSATRAVDVQASARTIAALSKQPIVAEEQEDPWEHQDPWHAYKTPPKQSRHAPPGDLPAASLEAIATRVKTKLQNDKTFVKACEDGDADMTHDDRVSNLEERLNLLEGTVQHHHEQQVKAAAELGNQIGQVKSQVDRQTSAIHSHIDSKMSEQLRHIEALLAKKPRTE